jgi:hypothetical protein
MFGRSPYRKANPWLWMAVILGAWAFDSFVFRCLWNWHVAYLFNIRTLNIFQAAGLGLVVMMFKSVPDEEVADRFLDVFWRNVSTEVAFLIAGLGLHLLA